MNLTENDVKAALEIHENSNPCTRSLREFDEDGKPGQKASYCIMGLVAAGVARNRHRSFDSITDSVNFEGTDITSSVQQAAKLEDDPVYLNDRFMNMGALKQWQGGVLRRLLKKIESSGPISLDE
jgi:hypothetical protein